VTVQATGERCGLWACVLEVLVVRDRNVDERSGKKFRNAVMTLPGRFRPYREAKREILKKKFKHCLTNSKKMSQMRKRLLFFVCFAELANFSAYYNYILSIYYSL
jgi:hypothetical protein